MVGDLQKTSAPPYKVALQHLQEVVPAEALGRRLAQAAQRVAGEPRGEASGSGDAVDGGGGEIRGPRIRPVTAGAEETPKTHAARLENLTS